MNKQADSVQFKVKPHQLYNTLMAGAKINRKLSRQLFLTEAERQGFKQQSDYQQHLLDILFEVVE